MTTAPPAARADRPLLVGVGGFLGAGKTTAILSAATTLRERGRRVAVITNDQASGLVDTAAARAALEAPSVAEIAGGCFCCRFDDLARTLAELIERARPEVILAEAVGSCTDLAATVYQPIRRLDVAPVRLGPLTVVADAVRLRRFQRSLSLPRLPADVGYLYGQQLAEADVLLLNKTDLVGQAAADALLSYLGREHPGVPAFPVVARTGAGLEAWLARLNPGLPGADGETAAPAGGRVLDLDYDRYAAAEGCLGWLNLEGTVAPGGAPGGDWAAPWARALLSHVTAGVTRAAGAGAAVGAEVAHLKLRLEAVAGAPGSCTANLVGADRRPSLRLAGAVSGPARLTLNARVATAPETLLELVEAALAGADAAGGTRTTVTHRRCLAPARPVPTYRLSPA